ncbi:MAG: acetyl-CoA carboxylase biotin carboxyl carrier protein [Bacillota bacterium]|nr:acetyl-CoA carboxylase biotin carboxyl carrier protein [Bacillota bacterium]
MKDMKALIKMFDESESDYLSFSKGDFKIKLRKNSGISFPAHTGTHAPMPSHERTSVVKESVSVSPSSEPASNFAQDYFEVKSPIVGVFYAAKEPGAAPFVKEGDRVEKGQVLCILESMKMLNEVKSPIAGKVVKVCSSNESLVEFGQVLFLLEE